MWGPGCVFAPRCPHARDECRRSAPPSFPSGGATRHAGAIHGTSYLTRVWEPAQRWQHEAATVLAQAQWRTAAASAAKDGVSTRERVLDVVEEMGFTPKSTAVTLARKGVGRIGVLAPFTSYMSYGRRLNGVLETCADRGIDVVVFDVPSVASAPSPLLRTLPATGRPDGLLIMGVPLENAMASRLANSRLATVLVDSRHEDLNWVNVDDEAGGFQVGTHLTRRGHSSFAYVTEGQRSTDYTSPGQLRRRGLMRAVHQAGLGDDAMQWIITANNLASGRRAAERILQLDNVPTAVFAHQDELAAGLLAGFRAAGRHVPDDIAVVGYDGTSLPMRWT